MFFLRLFPHKKRKQDTSLLQITQDVKGANTKKGIKINLFI